MVDRILDIALEGRVRKTKNVDGYFEDKFSAHIRKCKEIIVLDVGGEKFHVSKSTFATWPTTRLSRLVRARNTKEVMSLCDGFYPATSSLEGKREYFFNRNFTSFNSILDIYRSGRLHCIKTACAITYLGDLDYWGFSELYLDPCCALDYYVEKDTCQKELEGERILKAKAAQRAREENFGDSCIGKARTWLWDLAEHPETSTAAKV